LTDPAAVSVVSCLRVITSIDATDCAEVST
jgi:hypothetical protein